MSKQVKEYSPTYPQNWTEEERKEAEKKLTKAERNELLQALETPPSFWRWADKHWSFDIDVCASNHNAKTLLFIPKESDALAPEREWLCPGNPGRYRAWCNPGFKNVGPWHLKACTEANKHPANVVVVAGIPGASQDWYKFAYRHADEIIHLRPRIHYLCPWPLAQNTNTRESVLYVYRKKVVRKRPAITYPVEWKADE